MKIIYEPKGRALEYAPLAVSLYRWCPFKCSYCFVPSLSRATGHGEPYPRKDAIKSLKADAKELADAGDQREILMSFTTDPYQPIEQEHRLTSTAIRVLINAGLHFTILTKAGIPSLFDLERLQEAPDLFRYGTTLVFTREEDRRIWEPNAAPTRDRVRALMIMHNAGIRTWVSLEPMIYPDQTLSLICITAPYVDEYRLGALNHAGKTFTDDQMREYVGKAEALLKSFNKKYIFKKDLQKFLEVPK
jgi:DNA repair photolyase